MSETDHLALLRDPRLAELITAATPAWLWSPDATRILWANAVGAALFGASTLRALIARSFDPKRHPAAAQVARLADALPEGGAPRLERLRGFAPGVGRLLTCRCVRLAFAEDTAILVAATEAAGPRLTAAERLRRLFEGFDGPFATFSSDGTLVHATPGAARLLGDAGTLAAAGGAELAAAAFHAGQASGDTPVGRLTLERFGSDPTVLFVTIAPQPEPSIQAGDETAAPDAPEAPVAETATSKTSVA